MRWISLLAVVVVLGGVGQADAAEFFFDPDTPYLSAADIPDGFYLGGSPVALEDFEDGTLDFGITVSGGMTSRDHGRWADSVDADDGEIDGSGLNGIAWWEGSSFAPSLTFTFSDPLPTAAGLVWTDGGSVHQDSTTFEAFGPGMVPLGTVGPVWLSDDTNDGTTAEDRFFGVQEVGGILAISVMVENSTGPGGIEVDHVQYGVAVPEPSTLILCIIAALGLVGYGLRRRGLRPGLIGLVCAVAILSLAGPAHADYVAKLDTFEVVLEPEIAGSAVFDPFIMYDPGASEHGAYRMWFTESDDRILYGNDRIRHAWSQDGVHFDDRQTVHTSDPRGDVIPGYDMTGNAVVVKTGSEYRLYHFNYHFSPLWSGGIDVASNSQDGINFSSHRERVIDPLPGEASANRPGPMLIEENKYVMYFARDPEDGNFPDSIWRIVSDDGLTWPSTEGSDRREVLESGRLGEWDWQVARPMVFRLRNDQEHYGMFFMAGDENWETAVGFTTSPDGVDWGERVLLFDEGDISAATGLAIDQVSTPRYLRDLDSGVEYLYFSYTVKDGPTNIGRVQLVPEPSTLILCIIAAFGLVGYGLWRTRVRVLFPLPQTSVLVVLLMFLCLGDASAAKLNGAIGGGGIDGSFGNFRLNSPTPNNDDFQGAGNPNTPHYRLTFNSISSGSFVFVVDDDGKAPTEYRWTTTVTNNTGVRWGGYQLELGYDHWPSFVPVSGNSPVDFDAPISTADPATASKPFDVYHSPFFIEWSNGLVEPGETVDFSFSLDIGDGLSTVNPGGAGSWGRSAFCLRQTPIEYVIPEPSTVVLLGIGAVVLLVFGWREHGTRPLAR